MEIILNYGVWVYVLCFWRGHALICKQIKASDLFRILFWTHIVSLMKFCIQWMEKVLSS